MLKRIWKKLPPLAQQILGSLIVLAIVSIGATGYKAIKMGINNWNSSQLKAQLTNYAYSDVGGGEELRLAEPEPTPTPAPLQKALDSQNLPATLVAAAKTEEKPTPEPTPTGIPDSVLAIQNLKQQLEKNEWPDIADPNYTFSVEGEGVVDLIGWLSLWENEALIKWGQALVNHDWNLAEEMSVEASLEQRELGTLPLKIAQSLEAAAPTWSKEKKQEETNISLPPVSYRAPAYSAAAQAATAQGKTETEEEQITASSEITKSLPTLQPTSAPVNIIITAMSDAGDGIEEVKEVGTLGVLVTTGSGNQVLLEKGAEVAEIEGSGEETLRYCVDCGQKENGEPIRLALVPEAVEDPLADAKLDCLMDPNCDPASVGN